MSSNSQLAFELQSVVGKFRRTIISNHDCSKLKSAAKQIIFWICELKNGKPVTISEIANKIGVTLAAVTHQINALEKQGLLKRLSGDVDRRLVMVRLTEKGNMQVEKLKKEFAEKTRILTGFLGEDDTKDLIRLVKKMSKYRESIK